MNLFSTDPKVWVEGLKKRKWYYATITILSLWLLGDWYFHRPITRIASYTFESLQEDIHYRDAILTKGWRVVWAKLPNAVRQHIPGLTPPIPASQVRLNACRRFPRFGEKALPFIVPKLHDKDPSIVKEALVGILDIGVANEETFDGLVKLAKNKQMTMSLRRLAMLIVVALHGKEDRCLPFLSGLEDPLNYDPMDSLPFASMIRIGTRVVRGTASYAPGEFKALSIVLMSWSNADYIRLLKSDVKGIKLLAIFLLQHHREIDDDLRVKIQELRFDEDDSVRTYAAQLAERWKYYRRGKGIMIQ